MGKKQKKGEKGAAVNYITRTQAVKKLQISLANFRRLCILRGIYPRDPKNKKKVGKGSTAARTYYYRKDIQFLLHEPILNTMREEKIWAKKLKRAMIKREMGAVKALEEGKPVLTLNHVIKDRYPSFIDALRDLDDALSMIFLFATLPADDKIKSSHVTICQKLALEFTNYVTLTHSLRKVFLSIKGIYYQAQICGETITWIVPYQFSQAVPTDVDFRVMSTFLELYETLLGFVNYKLYTDLNLVYPPRLDTVRDQGDAGLSALLIQSRDQANMVPEEDAEGSPASAKVKKSKSSSKQQERLEALEANLPAILARSDKDTDMMEVDGGGMTTAQPASNKSSAIMLEEDVPVAVVTPTTPEEMVPHLGSLVDEDSQRYGSLFAGYHFFLSREVPRPSLEFIIRSMGGKVGWDSSAGTGSPYPEHDAKITHHILDRPSLPAAASTDPRYQTREFLQPQWIYDCVNRAAILKTECYHPGEALPPHLSPFVVAAEGEYDPTAASSDMEEEELTVAPPVEVEVQHEAELEAERRGIPVAEVLATAVPASVPTAAPVDPVELSKIMMSKKDRQLYDKIQYGKRKKLEAVQKLKEKRKKLAGAS